MSGGYFDYNQYRIQQIADDIELLIEKNDGKYPAQVMDHFEDAVLCLRKAYSYAQRIDWLLSCDDSEENFLIRLEQELKKIDENPWRTI